MEVAIKETLITEPVTLNSFEMDEKVLTKSMSKTQPRQRIPFSADDEVIKATSDHAQLKDGGV